MSGPVACNTLWIGRRLGAVERACLRSVLRQGHALTLWCYDLPEGVPPRVRLRDAAEILPRDTVIAHKGGSHALFANRFRYELQRRAAGFWVDCDIYLVRPLDGLTGHVFGWAAPHHINTAVLHLPPDSPVLAPLLDLFDECDVPPWLPWRARAAAWLRLRRTGRSGLSHMPWGSAGPLALTWLAERHGLARCALPAPVFYPVHWDAAAWIRDPRWTLDGMLRPETRAVHLWNELIKGFKDGPAPPGSFLARLQAEGAPD
ncbi:MAG: hypothetical protein JO013_14080 [Alphaproteobacteria bacterium]|nr:hypothetical protein [Alphaproteobacteria bacterium]